MLGGLKGFFANQGLGPDVGEIAAWAAGRGDVFKREREGHGFAVEGQLDGRAFRLEWGRPQRTYISGHELRVRMPLELPPDLQLLIVTRSLQESLEKTAFDQFTRDNQTELGMATPEETRWLVMFSKIGFDGSKLLRATFNGVSGVPAEGPAWVEGPLGHALERAAGTFLGARPPFVLMTLRGKLYLRLELGSAEQNDIAGALAVFEVAAAAALRVLNLRSGAPEPWTTTLSTAWQAIGAPDPSERA